MQRVVSLKRLGLLLLVGLMAGCAAAGIAVAPDEPEPDAATESTSAPESEAPSEDEPIEAEPEGQPAEEAAETVEEPTSETPPASINTDPDAWQEMPVIPEVSDTAREIYRRGLEMGNDPHSFSVIGDCQNVSVFFLAFYDDPSQYDLGEHTDLQDTIDHFSGAFSRERAAANGGFNVASVLSPLWADPEACQQSESPLTCEFRRGNPSIAIISMETWWYDRPADTYAGYLRQIVEYAIDEGVVPILATKADNLEGDNGINRAVVAVAQEYDVPLWNFWRAVQPLPAHGLTDDQFHLTQGRPFFDDPAQMQGAWPVRNLTGLQALDAVWRGVVDTESTAEAE
jgi:hypothetical protein